MKKLICAQVIALLLVAGAVQTALGEIPGGGVGFAGMLSGVVVAKGDGAAFEMRVTAVARAYKHSKAGSPESLKGVTVAVRTSGDLQSAFVRQLRPEQRVTIDVVVGEKNVSLLELTSEQRKIAQGGSEKTDRARAASVKREGAAREEARQKDVPRERSVRERESDRQPARPVDAARDRTPETKRDASALSREVQQLRGEVAQLRRMVEQLSKENRELMEILRSQIKEKKK